MGKPPRFAVDLLMQDFRPWEPVKDLGRCAAARRAVLDRLSRSEKKALQEVDGGDRLSARVWILVRRARHIVAAAALRIDRSTQRP